MFQMASFPKVLVKIQTVFSVIANRNHWQSTLSKFVVVSYLLDYWIIFVSRLDHIICMCSTPWGSLCSGWHQPTPSALEARTQVYIWYEVKMFLNSNWMYAWVLEQTKVQTWHSFAHIWKKIEDFDSNFSLCRHFSNWAVGCWKCSLLSHQTLCLPGQVFWAMKCFYDSCLLHDFHKIMRMVYFSLLFVTSLIA